MKKIKFLIAAKTLADFRLNLRAQVRAYWKGLRTKDEFIVGFFNAVDRGYNQAFRQGAADCGVKPDDYPNEARTMLQEKINSQFGFIVELANDIVTQENGGKLGSAFTRIEVWISRYGEIAQMAKGLVCGDQNMKWVLGVAEHCSSCLKLNGIVKPASFWNSRGILPRIAGADYLECKGYNCKCSLEPTDDPATKGRFPSLP